MLKVMINKIKKIMPDSIEFVHLIIFGLFALVAYLGIVSLIDYLRPEPEVIVRTVEVPQLGRVQPGNYRGLERYGQYGGGNKVDITIKKGISYKCITCDIEMPDTSWELREVRRLYDKAGKMYINKYE